jgi:hypothetical protein
MYRHRALEGFAPAFFVTEGHGTRYAKTYSRGL